MSADQRFVISARILGGIHRDKPKLKMFMISVLWSDEAEVIIYRSFTDFRKFHRQLKKKFPKFNPFHKTDRIIPKFTGKARRSSLQQKGSNKSVRKMKLLEKYCTKLLSCEPNVTQSSEVTRFFTPKDHDLQQDFTKNTVMIMMADDLTSGDHGHSGGVRHSMGNVTHPFVTQTFRCVAPYETKDTKNKPFKVAMNEKLDVLIKDPAGWWLVENESKKLAWFPAPYLEVLDDDEEEEDEYLGGSLYCAMKNYSTKKVDEVSVSIGSVVEVLRKSEDGWWLIRFNGKVGYVPSMYLQPYNNPRAGLHGLHRKIHSSSLNLTSSREPQAPSPPTIIEENNPQHDHDSRQESSVSARFQRAQSLDVLSESWLQTHAERDASTSDGTNSILSSLSSGSDSDLNLEVESESPTGQPEVSPSSGTSSDLSVCDRRSSNTSTDSSCSTDSIASTDSNSDSGTSTESSARSESTEPARSTKNETASRAPRVPPRPKAQEILTRCTSMTRKAAMVNRTLLQDLPQPIQSR